MGMDGEQNIFLYNRHELLLSGIIDVCEFCEASVEMTIADGFVGVDGEDLKIDKFDSQTGAMKNANYSYNYYSDISAPEQSQSDSDFGTVTVKLKTKTTATVTESVVF